jgi:hypothetical protein
MIEAKKKQTKTFYPPEISHCGYRIILKPSRFQKKPYGGPAEEIRRGF